MITIYQKNDQLVQISITENNEKVNLKDLEICFVISDGNKCIIKKTLSNDIKVIDEENGLIEVKLTHEDTDVRAGTYKCEVLLTDVNGNRYTVIQDKLKIIKSYTKEC